jgi:hypothetical protein
VYEDMLACDSPIAVGDESPIGLDQAREEVHLDYYT